MGFTAGISWFMLKVGCTKTFSISGVWGNIVNGSGIEVPDVWSGMVNGFVMEKLGVWENFGS